MYSDATTYMVSVLVLRVWKTRIFSRLPDTTIWLHHVVRPLKTFLFPNDSLRPLGLDFAKSQAPPKTGMHITLGTGSTFASFVGYGTKSLIELDTGNPQTTSIGNGHTKKPVQRLNGY